MALAGTVSGKPRKSAFAFALGTRIDTPDGPRPVEALQPGDLISTLDNGSQALRWIGRRWVSPPEMAFREDLQPLRLEAGVLGNERALLISPRHRVLLNDWRAQVYFGEDQILVPAQALLNGATVRQVLPLAGVTYLHLLFDRHEVILSEGALSESLHLGETGLGTLDPAQRQEIEALFPDQALERRRMAFPTLRMAEARALRLPG
ncbi:MAG: Hint domain-containing protein [Rhodobacteraceae bacterium]|nr:Hint domain-containing protein [Paracoccaceae bacterium]